MKPKKSVLQEQRVRPIAATAAERRHRAKLERLRQAVEEGVKSGRAKDSSIEAIIAELNVERKARRR
jgi:hypothetical protein